MNKTLKNNNNNNNKIKNKTKRNKDKEVLCNKSLNTYKSFEENFDEILKKKNIDILSTSYNLEKQVVRELKKAVSPSNIMPQNDYYSYINERWLKSSNIEAYQEYLTQVDNFRLAQDKVFRELIELIENYLKDPNTKHTELGKCIKTAYESYKKFNTNEETRNLAKLTLEKIDAFRTNSHGLWLGLGKTCTNEIMSWGSPFVLSLNPDEKNPKIFKCYLDPPQVSLLDIDIYFDDETDNDDDKKYKNKYRKVYFKYLNDVFNVAFGENHGFNTKDVYDCEIELLNAIHCDLIKNKDEDSYNLITKKEALQHFGFNWEEFCKGVGFETIPDDFVTSNVNYLLCGTKLLKENWNSVKWRTYWIYVYIRQQTRWNKEGWNIFYEFQGKFLRGQKRSYDEYIRPIFAMGFSFNSFLTNQYVSHYKNQQAIDYVKTMAKDLKIVFKRIVSRNKWMQPKTKKIALEKLEAIKLIVGSPEHVMPDPLLDYKADDPWGNLVKMAEWRQKQAIKLVGKGVIDVPMIDWSQIPPKFITTQAYIVNAMYTPTENSVYVPLGYIQKPFVDLEERGIEYNLAHIGFTIAHEMSHALDELGSKYDKEGKLNDWWTEKDKEDFRKIQENIVKQYEKYASYDGIYFDVWASIGEDLADISGFSICQEYLRDFQFKNQDILPIVNSSFEAFFIYFALQSRQKISKRAILAQLKTNPHPLDKYRCNVPLSRSRIFRAIYNVKKGDKMWWSKINNVWAD
jgi:putative endopeptidase